MSCKSILVPIGVSMALVLGLSACQAEPGTESDSDAPDSTTTSATTTPSPSNSSTPMDPVQVAEERNVSEAKQRYLEFQEITTAHSKAGTGAFKELMGGGYLGTSEIQKEQQHFWEQFTDLKLKQVGEAGIEFLEVVKYEGDALQKDATGQRVHLVVCIDNSDKDVVNPDGTSALRSDSPDEVRMTVTMQGQGQGGVWSVNENSYTGESC